MKRMSIKPLNFVSDFLLFYHVTSCSNRLDPFPKGKVQLSDKFMISANDFHNLDSWGVEGKLLITSSYFVLNFRDDWAKEYSSQVFVSVWIEGTFLNQPPD